MSKFVDARGRPCPQPVVMTKKALEEAAAVTTIVDNETSAKNVSGMAEKAGCTIEREDREDGIYLHIRRAKQIAEAPSAPASGPTVIFISANGMGRGPEELNDILIRAFLHALGDVSPLPDVIIFVNTGVELAVAGSPALEDLRALSERGVEILVCGRCLGYFELQDRIAVGQISNMYTIAETLLQASKVIAL